MRRSYVSVLALGALLAGAPAQADPGDAVRGKTLYRDVGCYACHGLAGQGAQATGPRLARTALPFAAFETLLRRPLNQMPPYSAAVLPEQDAADIYAYVAKLPAPPDPKSIALLRPDR